MLAAFGLACVVGAGIGLFIFIVLVTVDTVDAEEAHHDATVEELRRWKP